MHTRTLTAFARRRRRGCRLHRRARLRASRRWTRRDVAHRLPKAAEVANTKWWEQFGDPGTERTDRDGAAREPRRAHRGGARRAVPRRARRARSRQRCRRSATARTRAARARARRPAAAAARRRSGVHAVPGHARRFWQIDFFGRVRRLSEAAQAQVYASEQAQRGVVLTVVAGVANSYITLRALDRQLEIALATGGQLRRDRAHLRIALQVGPRFGIRGVADRIAVPAGAGRDSLPSVSRSRHPENRLSILLGHNPGPIARGKSIDQLIAPLIPADLPSTVLERRPDILQAEQNLVAANANIGAAKALYYPTLSLTGALGSASTAFGNFLTGPASLWTVGGGAHRPHLHRRRHRGPGAHGRRPEGSGGQLLPAGDTGRVSRDQRRAGRLAEQARRSRSCRRSAWWRCANSRGSRGCASTTVWRVTSRCWSPTTNSSRPNWPPSDAGGPLPAADRRVPGHGRRMGRHRRFHHAEAAGHRGDRGRRGGDRRRSRAGSPRLAHLP